MPTLITNKKYNLSKTVNKWQSMQKT